MASNTVFLDPIYTKSLLVTAQKEGLISLSSDLYTGQTLYDAGHVGGRNLQEVLYALLLFDDLILDVPLFSDGDFDLSLLSDEGLMARAPHNMFLDESAQEYIPDLGIPACDLYEAALLFEPFLLPLMWSMIVEGEVSDRLKRLHISGRVHLWRVLIQTIHDMFAAKESREPIEPSVRDSRAWIQNHPDVAREFFGIVLDEDFRDSMIDWIGINLKSIWQIVGLAEQYDATLLMHRQNAWYASDGVVLPSQKDAKSRSLAMTAIRTQLAEERPATVRELSVGEVLRLRKRPEVVGLREATDAVVASVALGQESIVVAASRELMNARKHLAKQGVLGMVETICTYAAVPITVAEAALALPPIAGLSIGATAVVSNASQRRIKRKHAWLSTVFDPE